jgi:hypothetical protein
VHLCPYLLRAQILHVQISQASHTVLQAPAPTMWCCINPPQTSSTLDNHQAANSPQQFTNQNSPGLTVACDASAVQPALTSKAAPQASSHNGHATHGPFHYCSQPPSSRQLPQGVK